MSQTHAGCQAEQDKINRVGEKHTFHGIQHKLRVHGGKEGPGAHGREEVHRGNEEAALQDAEKVPLA